MIEPDLEMAGSNRMEVIWPAGENSGMLCIYIPNSMECLLPKEHDIVAIGKKDIHNLVTKLNHLHQSVAIKDTKRSQIPKRRIKTARIITKLRIYHHHLQ